MVWTVFSIDQAGWGQSAIRELKAQRDFKIELSGQSFITVFNSMKDRVNPFGPLVEAAADHVLRILRLPVPEVGGIIADLSGVIEKFAGLGAVDGALGLLAVILVMAHKAGYEVGFVIHPESPNPTIVCKYARDPES